MKQFQTGATGTTCTGAPQTPATALLGTIQFFFCWGNQHHATNAVDCTEPGIFFQAAGCNVEQTMIIKKSGSTKLPQIYIQKHCNPEMLYSFCCSYSSRLRGRECFKSPVHRSCEWVEREAESPSSCWWAWRTPAKYQNKSQLISSALLFSLLLFSSEAPAEGLFISLPLPAFECTSCPLRDRKRQRLFRSV